MRIGKLSLLVASLVVLFSFSMAATDEVKPDDIVGIWLIAEDGEVVEKVEIYQCEDRYCGKIVWLKAQEGSETPVADSKNKSEELRGRPLLGLEVLHGYEFNGEDPLREEEFCLGT